MQIWGWHSSSRYLTVLVIIPSTSLPFLIKNKCRWQNMGHLSLIFSHFHDILSVYSQVIHIFVRIYCFCFHPHDIFLHTSGCIRVSMWEHFEKESRHFTPSATPRYLLAGYYLYLFISHDSLIPTIIIPYKINLPPYLLYVNSFFLP